MFDFINNMSISPYGLLGTTGVFGGIIPIYIFSKKKELDFGILIYIYLWGCLFAILGAKILYLITNAKLIVTLIITKQFTTILAYQFLTSGFVFYGGLFGAIIGVIIGSKFFEYNTAICINILSPSLSLVHAFGRLGCLYAGCCYGKATNSFLHITYHNSKYAPNNINLIPVQLYEALFEIVLFAILCICIYREVFSINANIRTFNFYVAIYAKFRFVLEFYRGDSIRGHIFCLSTSQWISILCLLYVILYEIFHFMRRKRIARIQ